MTTRHRSTHRPGIMRAGAALLAWVSLVPAATAQGAARPGQAKPVLATSAEVALLEVKADTIASGFQIPWAVEVLGESEFLVTERLGGMRHIRDGRAVALEGLPESRTVRTGALILGGYNDVSLHPRFRENGLVYLAYVNTGSRMAVARFNFADRTVRDFEVIFESNALSIGSRIAWQDDDHFFVTQGIAGAPRPEPGAQDPAHHAGKIHRLRADGSIPADNPILGRATAPTSVWSYGHRDPQGLLVDGGTVYATEHGPLGGDELNVIQKAGNYGWPLFSYGSNYDLSPVGTMTEAEARRSTILPIKAWGPRLNMAPSGLVRLRGSAFPALDGSFVWGSLARRQLIAYDPIRETTSILLDRVGRVRDVAQLPGGGMVILLDATDGKAANGVVVRLTPR